MWTISRLQGYKHKWAVSRNGMLKGHVEVDEYGDFHGKLDLSKYDDTFKDVNYIQKLVFKELADEDLLDTKG